MKKLVTLTSAILLIFNVYGQNVEKKWSLGLLVGKPEYVGDLGSGFLDFVPHYATIGVTGARYLSPSFDVALQVEYGDYGYFQDWTTNFLASMVNGNMLFKYKLNNGYILQENARVAPFLAVGGGFAYFTQGRDLNTRPGIRTLAGTDLTFPIGAGIRFNIFPALSIQYQLLANLTGSDMRDLIIQGTPDHFMNHTVGIFVNLGVDKTDSDLDGVLDKYDLCPKTPVGVEVTPDGCPVDRDGDGIPDPDDRCPFAAGPKEYRGCPDTDNDGLPDIDDECPTVPGLLEYNGCPLVKEGDQKVFDDAIRGIQFESDRDMIKAVSYPILDNVVNVMRNNPHYRLEIIGHTDSTGDESHNLDLSQRRAKAVKEYLVGRGNDPSRIRSNGYGSSRPVATNNTSEGRALNRRVEFKVSR